jgi:hypothetical protein
MDHPEYFFRLRLCLHYPKGMLCLQGPGYVIGIQDESQEESSGSTKKLRIENPPFIDFRIANPEERGFSF